MATASSTCVKCSTPSLASPLACLRGVESHTNASGLAHTTVFLCRFVAQSLHRLVAAGRLDQAVLDGVSVAAPWARGARHDRCHGREGLRGTPSPQRTPFAEQPAPRKPAYACFWHAITAPRKQHHFCLARKCRWSIVTNLADNVCHRCDPCTHQGH